MTPMWVDVVAEVARTVLLLGLGGLLAELGWDVGSLIRNSGRRKDDHS